MNDRGQIGIVRLFLSLGVAAMLFWVIAEVTAPLFDYTSEQSSDPVAQTGTQYLQQFGDFFLVFALFVSFFGLIAYAVFSREVLR